MFSKSLHSVLMELAILDSIAKGPELSVEPEMSETIDAALLVGSSRLSQQKSLSSPQIT